MKKMLKRADGSTSQRGLWDNIRANKGSGKKPTKEMLKQEAKIKSKKKTGGNWLEKSKELKFGGPPVDKQAERDAMAKELGMVKNAATGKWENPKPSTTPAQPESLSTSIYKGFQNMFSAPKESVRSEKAGIRRKTGGKKKMGGKNC